MLPPVSAGEVARPPAVFAVEPTVVPGRESRVTLRPVFRICISVRAVRAEAASWGAIRESLPSAQAVVTAASPRVDRAAPLATPAGMRTDEGRVPAASAVPVT